MIGANVSCPICGFPAPAPTHAGQTATCANCGDKLEAEMSSGLGFTLAMFLGIGLLFYFVFKGAA